MVPSQTSPLSIYVRLSFHNRDVHVGTKISETKLTVTYKIFDNHAYLEYFTNYQIKLRRGR